MAGGHYYFLSKHCPSRNDRILSFGFGCRHLSFLHEYLWNFCVQCMLPIENAQEHFFHSFMVQVVDRA